MINGDARDRLIVALDLDAASSTDLGRELAGHVGWVKIGMTLFYSEGPSIVAVMRELGFSVFLDLKLHDIPHQVQGAARALGRLGAGMITVHASGGPEMIAAAVRGSADGAAEAGMDAPAVLAVTVLTSMDDVTLASLGVAAGLEGHVDRLAAGATQAGAHGVVCSPNEAARLRVSLGQDTLIVTPGVRPAGAALGDQSRVATPYEAIASGASHLVVGRPITESDRPIAVADEIVAEIGAAL